MELSPTTERAASRATTRPRALAGALAAALLVALVALLPRAIGLDDFLTTDEAYHWITRTERFAAAAAEWRWADTILTGHPGVSLMWLGSLGLSLEQAAVGLGAAAPPDRLGHLAWLRLGPALAHSLAIGLGYLLLRRLLRPGPALAAALLWATSPYLVAHGRLLHLDALLTDLCTLTLLAALVSCRSARPLGWLALSGVLAGLALLTKGPALIMLPFVGLTLFAFALAGRLHAAARAQQRRPSIVGLFLSSALSALRSYAIWLGLALLTAFLLWPALWVAPGAAIGRYLGEIVGNGGRPNGDGQFFLGRADADPGPLFYPIAGAFRLSPLELIGLAALLAAALAWLAGRRRPGAGGRREGISAEGAALLALAAFVIFWTAVMTLGPKKFDRYTLPTWPALLALSAAGLAWLGGQLLRYTPWHVRPGAPGRLSQVAGCLLVLLPQAIVLGLYHPYYLSYYSPLLGGGPVAQRTFLIGWGEGMDQAGAWLRARPDIGEGQILSALPPTLQPFVPVPVQEVRAIDSVPANYAVVYLESIQRGDAPAIYERIGETLPLHTVRIHGIDYAQIHQLPKPYDTAVGAEFAGALRLRGFSARQEGQRLIVTPAWDVRAAPGADYQLFLHLYDAAGAKITQIDVAPGGASAGPTASWQPGQQVAVPLPIDLPAGLPPGAYRLALGLYTLPDFARAPLTAGATFDPALAGNDAALLGTVRLGEGQQP